jgi:hypothetical protein
MAKGMNWRRNSYQLSVRRYGSISVAHEREWLDNDPASRWLNRHQNRRPPTLRPMPVMVPATAASSARSVD